MNLKQLSLLRKKIHLLKVKRNGLERIALGRSAMVPASLLARRFRPGAPVVYYLSASVQGESRHRYVRRAEVDHYRQRALAWQKFQKAMASWVKVNKEVEKALRQIGRLRCDPLPGGRRAGEE
jgi:kynureninase